MADDSDEQPQAGNASGAGSGQPVTEAEHAEPRVEEHSTEPPHAPPLGAGHGHVHLPRRRHVSPWSSRLLIAISIMVALVLMPIWLDPALVGQLQGFTATPAVAPSASGPPAAVTHSSMPPGDAPWPMIADSFSRNVANGWGTAELGGSYELVGAQSGFGVDGSAATAVASSALSEALLPAAVGRDVTVQVELVASAVPESAELQVYIMVRDGAARDYRATLHVFGDGAVTATIERVSGDTAQLLEGPASIPDLVLQPGSQLHIEVQATGSDPTTIGLRAWTSARPDPTTWDLRATDFAGALQQPGAVGLGWQLIGGAPAASTQLHFDDLQASSTDHEVSP